MTTSTSLTSWNVTMKNDSFGSIYTFDNLEEEVLFNLCCCVVLFVTLTGNSLVILMILASKRMRTVFNLLILNLAVADFLSGLNVLLFYGVFVYTMYIISRNRFSGEIFQQIVCQFTLGGSDILGKVSVFTVAVISLERYLVIKHPLRRKNFITKRKTLAIIVFLWVMGVVLSIPIIVYIVEAFQKAADHDEKVISCHQLAISTNGLPSRVILALELTTGCTIPMLIIVYTSYKIIRTLWRSGVEREGTNLAVLKSRRQVTKLIISVAVAFMVFWLPWAIWLVMILTGLITEVNFDDKTMYSVLLLQFVNTSANPVLYSIQSRTFRRRLVKMLCGGNLSARPSVDVEFRMHRMQCNQH